MSDEITNSVLQDIQQSTLDSLRVCLDSLRSTSSRLDQLERQKREEISQIQNLLAELTLMTSEPGMPELGGQREFVWNINPDDMRIQAESAEDELTRLDQFSSKLKLLLHQVEQGGDYLESEESPHSSDAWEAALRTRLIQGQEEERSRLAREIHDGPAQVLANAIMGLDFCEELAKRGHPQVVEELCKLRIGMREGLNELRHFIFNLRPAALEELGLVGTLCRYIEDYQTRFGIDVALSNAQMADQLPHEQEIVVFRVVQEALQNVRKHANAANVVIAFSRPSPRTLTVSVSDNGGGFDYDRESLRKGPVGLASMRERAESIGGSIQIKTGPGRGTEVFLSVPCGRV